MTLTSLLEDLALLRSHYVELQRMAARQQEAVAAADVASLQRIVDEKQKVLGQIQQISARAQAWRRQAEGLQDPERDSVNRAVASVEEELRRLLELEEQTQRGLVRQRDDTSDQLKRINQGRKARRLYGGGAGGERFIDRGG
jgi:flagellar biosynthesis/type III secretory pathway chaperone